MNKKILISSLVMLIIGYFLLPILLLKIATYQNPEKQNKCIDIATNIPMPKIVKSIICICYIEHLARPDKTLFELMYSNNYPYSANEKINNQIIFYSKLNCGITQHLCSPAPLQIYFKRGDYKNLLIYKKDILKSNQLWVEYLFLKDYKNALKNLNISGNINKKDYKTYILRGKLNEKFGDKNAAYKDYNIALAILNQRKQKKYNFEPYIYKGMLYEKLGKKQSAYRNYKTALNIIDNKLGKYPYNISQWSLYLERMQLKNNLHMKNSEKDYEIALFLYNKENEIDKEKPMSINGMNTLMCRYELMPFPILYKPTCDVNFVKNQHNKSLSLDNLNINFGNTVK